MTPDLDTRIREELRVQMARQRLSQQQVARQLGRDQTWLSRRLNGVTPLTITDAESIASILGITLAQLLADEPV